MNILVTGGTGYIGEHFIPELIDRGHKVRLLVRNIEKANKIFGTQCDYHIGDITDKDSLKGCCDSVDIVFHMVAKVGNELPSEENFAAFRKVNVEGTRNIIEESKDVKKFIFISSIAAMGIVKENPINENSKCSPYLPYQITKYEAEQAILERCKEGFPGIIIRPTKVYGVGEHEYSYLTLAKLCKKGIFPKVGRGHNYTSNIYITDFVQALVKLVDNGVLGETYILTSDESIDFVESGKIIAEVMGKKIAVIPVPAGFMIFAVTIEESILNFMHKKPIVTKKNIEATLTDRIYDVSKAKREIGFLPEISIEEGIRKTVNWYVEKGLL
jgi:Nucleoside-diphosphate-sugar epimerases